MAARRHMSETAVLDGEPIHRRCRRLAAGMGDWKAPRARWRQQRKSRGTVLHCSHDIAAGTSSVAEGLQGQKVLGCSPPPRWLGGVAFGESAFLRRVHPTYWGGRQSWRSSGVIRNTG
jgi:hypothetical protein